jgi:peptide/nickel transport system ATP-binding protein/oligopeptide transport system ATP-binding protein
MAISERPLIAVEGLRTEFRSARGAVRAVNDASFEIAEGETLALVGESGSGKSAASLSIMRLIDERVGRITGGTVLLRGADGRQVDLVGLPERQMRRIRGNDIAMVFQEPMTSLDPVHTVGAQIGEAIRIHQGVSRRAARAAAVEMLDVVGIPDPALRIDDYPHQLSGGMRQRVVIAMALSCRPALLIADEPTTALDVTIQAQILDLIRRLQSERTMAVLFITHNLGVVAEIADRVAVMYAGSIVETGPVRSIFSTPRHPYTRGLIRSIPRVDDAEPAHGQRQQLHSIGGSPPNLAALPPGCAFAPRCPLAIDRCREAFPALRSMGPAHFARCIRAEEVAGP